MPQTKTEKKVVKSPAVKKPVKTASSTPADIIGMLPLIQVSKIIADASENVRYFKEAPAKLEELAKSIKEQGVIEPLIVTAEKDGGYRLAAGFRRLAAAKQAGLKVVPCIVRELNAEQRLRLSLTENIQRKNLSPMEFALNCASVREKFKWDGEKSTKKVANFLNVSPATVTQMEKLLVLDVDKRRLVHERVLGAQAGQDIAEIVKEYGPEKAQKVLSKAAEIEQEEREEKQAKADKKAAEKSKGKLKPSEAARARKREKKEAAEKESGSPAISQRSVRKAAQAEGVAPKHARKVQDLIELLEVCLGAEISKERKGLIQAIIDWQRGRVDDVALMKALVIESAAKGASANAAASGKE
jgi:ParB family transcriptional regulator, chromosome partitioning protein